jgi:hypothetical protein
MLLALAGAAAAGCVGLGDDELTVTIWETQLQAEVDYPGLSGQAAAVSGSDGTAVGIAIEGATPGAEHAWGLRFGSCATPSQPVGPASDYPRLVVSTAGSASVETRIGTRLSLQRTYLVDVRVSVSDTTRVACGGLVAR